MPHLVSATIIFFLVLLQLKVICSQEPVLQYQRFAVNHIVLGCFAATDEKLCAEAVFYRNNQVFYDFGESVENDTYRVVVNISTQNNEEIHFMIDRDAEGRFQCAFHTLGARSFPVDIIGTYVSQYQLLFRP